MTTKKQFFQEIYPVIWNQYHIAYEQITAHDARFQLIFALLGAIVAIFPIINKTTGNEYIFFGYVVAGLICLFEIVPRKLWITFLNETQIEKSKFNPVYFFNLAKEDIYGVIPQIRSCVKEKKIALLIVLNLIIITTGLLSLNHAIQAEQKVLTYISIVLLFISTATINLCYQREYGKNFF